MTTIDYKKDYKALYLPTTAPVILEVPSMPFVVIDGQGNPNGPLFAQVTEALYAMSYAVKMSYKRKDSEPPQGYYPYKVFPLEGIWDLVDPTLGLNKDNLKYRLMMRQPEFLTAELFIDFLATLKQKKTNPYFDQLRFETITDGLCCQIMHLGSYDSEPESFEKIAAHIALKGYNRSNKTHREIYLSDPRKTAPDKLRTVLRVQLESL